MSQAQEYIRELATIQENIEWEQANHPTMDTMVEYMASLKKYAEWQKRKAELLQLIANA